MARSTDSRRRKTFSKAERGDPTPANVTLSLPADADWFPCPVCQGLLEVRTSRKNGKPYLVCDLCGLQMFVRKAEGVRRFRLMLSSGQVRASMRLGRLLEFYEDLARRLAELKKLRALHGNSPAFEKEEKPLVSQLRKSRKNLISALREKKRELEAQGRKKSK